MPTLTPTRSRRNSKPCEPELTLPSKSTNVLTRRVDGAEGLDPDFWATVYQTGQGDNQVQAELWTDDDGTRYILGTFHTDGRLQSFQMTPEQAEQMAQCLNAAAFEAYSKMPARIPTMADLDQMIRPEARQVMAKTIARYRGAECLFVGRPDGSGAVASVELLAVGDDHAVPVLLDHAQPGEVLIHNHPRGELSPSPRDIDACSEVGQRGVGSYIVNNDVSAIRLVVKPFTPGRMAQVTGGRPVYAGDTLEILINGQIITGRYEWAFVPGVMPRLFVEGEWREIVLYPGSELRWSAPGADNNLKQEHHL